MILQSLNLKAGEWVEVRSKEEILSTLDERGCLDAMPFMPEMLAFCGKRMRVYKRSHKTCDTITNRGGRRMTSTVHLEDARCDGSAHGGCQAECLLYWKEAWLKRVSAQEPSRADTPAGSPDKSAACARCDLSACTRKAVQPGESEPTYVCQATEVLKASSPIGKWDWSHYLEDYSSGNFGLKWMMGVLFYANYTALMNKGGRIGVRKTMRWLYNTIQKLRGRLPHPRARGKIPLGGKTPSINLNLQPGELVRVKSFEDILETIDWDYYNRGLRWDAEMAPYCGGVYRVRRRVSRIVDEKTGKMLHLKSEPVILEGVVCQSKYSNCRYFCPRAIYSYWREIWLERVEGKPAAAGPGAFSTSRTQDLEKPVA